MREVIFRGKLKADNGEFKKGDWVYGDLVRMKDGDNVKTFIYGFGEVIPDTVGQHIGLKDVKGKRIFEGDIFTYWNKYTKKLCFGIVVAEEWNCSCCNGVFGFSLEGNGSLDLRNHDTLTVDGNKHDNPELIKGW